MTCPDIGIHYVLVEWLFNISQTCGIVLLWEVVKLLWRIAAGTCYLTFNAEPCRVRRMKLKHVVIAMNPVLGMGLVRHKKLPRTKTAIVCSREEAEVLLKDHDIHELSIHVAGDAINIPFDTAVFHQVLTTTTNH